MLNVGVRIVGVLVALLGVGWTWLVLFELENPIHLSPVSLPTAVIMTDADWKMYETLPPDQLQTLKRRHAENLETLQAASSKNWERQREELVGERVWLAVWSTAVGLIALGFCWLCWQVTARV